MSEFRKKFILDVFNENINVKNKKWSEIESDYNYETTDGSKPGDRARKHYLWWEKVGSKIGEWAPGQKIDDNLDIELEEEIEIDNYFKPTKDITSSRQWQEFLAWKQSKEEERDFLPGNYVVIGCTHVPFHNSKFFDATIDLIKDLQPTGLVIAGDFLDMNSLSSHDVGKKPLEGVTLGWEYEQGNRALDLLDNAHNYDVKHFMYGNHCFSADTELLTENGWYSLKDYIASKGEIKFASVDKNNQIVYDLPKGVTVKEYSGIMHHYTGNKIDILVTPEHKMLYKDQSKSNIYKFGLSKDIKDKCIKFKTAVTNTNKDYPISDRDIKLAAWIHTDGSVLDNAYMVYQSKLATSNRIEELLDGYKYSKYSRKRDVKEICGKELKSTLECNEYYIHANEYTLVSSKYNLESWVNKLSKRQFDIFLEELVLGDGSKHKSSPDTSWMLYGIKDFLEQVQFYCMKNGHSTSLVEYRKGDFRLNIHVNRDETKLNSSKSKTNFEEKELSLTVWCPTMKLGTVICRRNGKISVQGNCDRFWRYASKLEPSKLGDALVNPTVALNLKEREYQVQESWKEAVVYLGKHLEVMHGDSCAQFSTKKHMDAFRTSVAYFHTHRIQCYMEGNTAAWNLGWGGDINSPAFDYATKTMKASWKNGFGVVHINEKGGYHVTPIVWHDNRFIFGNKTYN